MIAFARGIGRRRTADGAVILIPTDESIAIEDGFLWSKNHADASLMRIREFFGHVATHQDTAMRGAQKFNDIDGCAPHDLAWGADWPGRVAARRD